MTNCDKDSLERLERIYQQQHYFIDRHDGMAEKLINVLLVEATCFAFIFSINLNHIKNASLSLLHIILLSGFLLLFMISLCQLFFIIRPLSSKAKKIQDQSLINAENKKWILHSSIYYQGIVAQINSAKENEQVPSEQYASTLQVDALFRDYLQQTFILAQYSMYKKKKLETALIWMIITTISGISAALSLIIQF